jgi:ribosome maturation factor RimP
LAEGRHEQLLENLRALARGVVAECGLELVELTLHGPTRRRVLRVDIDRPGPQGVNLEDCKRVSEALGSALEREDPFEDRYVLEVSSPGLDRPIRSDDDIRRNVGRRVVVTTREPLAGRNRFHGLLTGARDGRLTIEEDDRSEVAIPLEIVESARQEVAF